MSLHPTSLIGFLTGSQAPKEERRPIGMPAANVVGEGFFYKEGANVKTWKYRKFTVFDNGHLMYFSPMRKLFKGELPIKAVVLSSPARGSRMTRPIDVMLGEEAFELQVKSLAAVRPLNLLFRTDEEGMLFLYYLSLACTVHNVPALLELIGKTQLYNECASIMHAATAGNTGGTESPLSAPNPPLGSPRDSPKTGAPDNIFRVKSVAASRRYSGTDAQQRESGMPPDSASGEIMQLSSPPPKQSAQPGLKGPSRLNVSRSSTVDSLLKDDRSDDGAPEDEFFFSLWRSGHDVTYKHEAVLADLKQLVISGKALPAITRPFWWRLALGVLSDAGPASWTEELNRSVSLYEELRRDILPVMSEAKNDPLSSPIGLSSPSDREWGKYYKAREKVNFIQLDINRLYLNDIEDSYFEDHDRRMALQNILVLWSTQHEETAYRQGMHELVGALYYVVEAEAEGWMSCIHVVEENGDKSSAGTQSSLMTWGGHPFRTLLTRENVEAHTFWLFERIMKDLECLYDPNSTAAGHPPVLHFCLGMQENVLSQVDADLCEHLESEEISCQLYGMRWGRLLLSREFRSMEMQVLRIWDFLFTCPSGASTQLSSAKSKSPARITKSSTESKKLYHTITKGNSSGGSGSFKGDVGVDGAKDVEHTGPVSEEEKVLLPKLVACTLDSSSNKAAADGKIDMSSLKWTPLPWDSILAPLQFVMVAMLVTIRTELLDSDNNMLMALLMRYPDTGDVNKILNLAHQMSLGLVRIDPKVVIKRQKKRDIMFKNFQMIGSKVSKSIRRNTTVASSTSQSAPGTPLLDETHHTNASVPKTSPRAGLAEHTSAPASEPGFEMEMNTGLFSPSIPMKKPTKKEESKAMLAYKKIVSLLTAEGEALLSAASLAEIYTNRVKCYDDVYQESSSSDEDITNKDVVRKKAEPPPPPTFDRSSISNRLRGLADVIDGKITLEQYENGIADNGYKIRDLALLNAATSNTTS